MTDQAPAPYAGPERVLSGVQPTGDLHLGNYLGALVKFARLQHEIPTFIFVADMHAITVWQEPSTLKNQVREIVAAYLATGLDPKVATIFAQSAVPEHAELAWVFNCVARLGWLDRMTQFKDKAGKHKERESVGLYTYPVLQAADILAYKATKVPVGEDQRQHLELTRDIAQKFNNDFDAPGFFPLPEALTPTRRTIRASTSPTTPTPSRRRSARRAPTPTRCPRRRRAWRAAPRRRTWWRSTPPFPARPRRRCSPSSPARASARSSRGSRTWRCR